MGEHPAICRTGAADPRRGCDALTEQKSFPLPSDLKVVPGTEAAQAAYPYYTQFVPADDEKFWF